jgi:hypothetical protein
MSTYDRRLVEHLLPAVWDSEYAYGMENPTAPDPDMPRAVSDPAHGNTLYAHIADIRSGWDRAPLRPVERRALLMRYGLDWTEQQIGRHEGVTRETMRYHTERGVGRIVDQLNGGESFSPTRAGARA